MGFGSSLSRHPFASSLNSSKSEAVKVVVRCRPMSPKERSQGHTPIIDMLPQRGIIYIRNPRRSPICSGKMFTFDSVYDWSANQDDIYENTVKPLVYSVLHGYNGTIFAYGQTGTGKTYTMLGSRCNTKEKGITSKCFEDIFRHITYASEHTAFAVRASYLEIYQEEARDLLTPGVRKKPLREDALRGVYVKGLQWVDCRSIGAIERVMRIGIMNRATAATNMNEHSSRSHAIFQITIEMQDRTAQRSRCGLRLGKLNLVDLAGSERQCKTGAIGDRLKESGKINLSLSALGNVISALVDGRCSHIPYRDSKLTQLLQDSLGGNSKCIMIANIGPASYNYDESLMTLRYASRAKYIKNKPTRNENSPLGTVLHHYSEEVRALQALLMRPRAGRGRGTETRVVSPASASEDSSSSTTTNNRLEHSRRQDVRGRRRSLSLPMHRSHPHRSVWKLHSKYHPETTVKMVRWIQEQIRDCQRPEADATLSLTEAELGVHNLVDDLSEATPKDDTLLSLAKLKEEASSRTDSTRTFLKMAAEVKELRQRALRQQRRQRAVLRSEQARLRREVALKHAVLQAYLAQHKNSTTQSSQLSVQVLPQAICRSAAVSIKT